MINDADRQIILNWEKTRTQPLTIHFPALDHSMHKTFEKFAQDLSMVAPSIRIKASDKHLSRPGFLLADNITYSALALEKELPPFLAALSWINSTDPEPFPKIQNLADKIEIPCRLSLYIALQCPHCPEMVRTATSLAAFSDKIELEIIDAGLFPQAAAEKGVMSAPCLILDNEFRWTGAVSAEEIVVMITQRDPCLLSSKTLKSILEQKDALWIARQMISADKIFKGFVDLILDKIWSVRLGAMVVLETIEEKSPNLAIKICPILIQEFDTQEIPVQGDILYALGLAGNLETKSWLQERLKHLEHQDLLDTAFDAIETIEAKY